MVHDNAFILFPFKVNDRELAELQMIVCAETQESPDRANELNEFLDSYFKVADDPASWEQYSLKWNGMPVVAADCDTSHGNSGSPVFDRKTNRLVGLLFAGQPDLHESFTPGWRRHEAIIPIEQIVAQVDSGVAGWRIEFDVQVD